MNKRSAHGFDSRGDDWRLRAACLDEDPELFYADGSAMQEQAKRVCRRCPVLDRCLAFALRVEDFDGVAGRKTGEERKAFVRVGMWPKRNEVLCGCGRLFPRRLKGQFRCPVCSAQRRERDLRVSATVEPHLPAIRAMIAEGVTQRDAAQYLGLTRTAVGNACRLLGIGS